jgi:hypothetical protein
MGIMQRYRLWRHRRRTRKRIAELAQQAILAQRNERRTRAAYDRIVDAILDSGTTARDIERVIADEQRETLDIVRPMGVPEGRVPATRRD